MRYQEIYISYHSKVRSRNNAVQGRVKITLHIEAQSDLESILHFRTENYQTLFGKRYEIGICREKRPRSNKSFKKKKEQN